MRAQRGNKSFWFTVEYDKQIPPYIAKNIDAYDMDTVNKFRNVHIILTIQENITIHSYEGSSFCHPNDQFNKIKGRSLALTRLLKNISYSVLSKEDRAFLCPQILYGHKKSAA
jgi:hypothetical protein